MKSSPSVRQSSPVSQSAHGLRSGKFPAQCPYAQACHSCFPDLVDRTRELVVDAGYGEAAEYVRRRIKKVAAADWDADALAGVLVGAVVNYRRSEWTFGAPPPCGREDVPSDLGEPLPACGGPDTREPEMKAPDRYGLTESVSCRLHLAFRPCPRTGGPGAASEGEMCPSLTTTGRRTGRRPHRLIPRLGRVIDSSKQSEPHFPRCWPARTRVVGIVGLGFRSRPECSRGGSPAPAPFGGARPTHTDEPAIVRVSQRFREGTSRSTLRVMSEARHIVDEAVSALDAEDRAWLQEQIRRYAQLLTYLREH